MYSSIFAQITAQHAQLFLYHAMKWEKKQGLFLSKELCSMLWHFCAY